MMGVVVPWARHGSCADCMNVKVCTGNGFAKISSNKELKSTSSPRSLWGRNQNFSIIWQEYRGVVHNSLSTKTCEHSGCGFHCDNKVNHFSI